MITETLRDSNSENFTFGGNPFSFLTSGVFEDANKKKLIDPIGEGWLRLTKDTLFQRGYAVVKKSFPSSLGVQIDLEFKIWRTDPNNQGADGFSVFLFNAKTDSFRIGGFGGSLGYAQFNNPGAESSVGLSDGYVGIGIDEFGNYSKGYREGIDSIGDLSNFEGRIGGDGFHDNSIGVRGPAPDYVWQTGNFKLDFKLQYENANISKRPTDSVYYRRIQVDITPGYGPAGNQYTISARMKTTKGSKFVTVLKDFLMDSIPPESLQLGFAASTGACINYHELRNLYITTPRGVRVTKNVDKLYANVGDYLTYTVDIYNQTDTKANGVYLKDYFDEFSKDLFRIDSVYFDNNGYEENVASKYSKTDLAKVNLTMEPRSQSTFIIKGRIKGCPSNNILTNIANTNIGLSGVIDPDVMNDTAYARTTITDMGLQAITDVRTTGSETPVTISVLDNDLASNHLINPSSVLIIDQPSHGSVVPGGISDLIYTPEADFAGVDSFHYSMSDNYLTDTAVVIIHVASRELTIPNIFTPNGDGINDKFEVKGIEFYDHPVMRICNRWGDEVYYNTNYQRDTFWDGNGLNEGTYYYWLVLKYKGKDILHKGWVLLKR